jgi:hypothetical protein
MSNPDMIITITEKLIVEAIIDHLKTTQLKDADHKHITVDFTAGRGANGLSATINIFDSVASTTVTVTRPIIEPVKEEAPKKVHKLITTKEVLEPVEEVEPEVIEEEVTVVTPTTIKQSVFKIQEDDEIQSELESVEEEVKPAAKKPRFNL